MNPTHIVMADGTAIPLTADAHGWKATRDGHTVYISRAIRTSQARTPATARWATA